jgi:hypothetical protein
MRGLLSVFIPLRVSWDTGGCGSILRCRIEAVRRCYVEVEGEVEGED